MIAVFFYFTARDEEKIMKVSSNPDHTITVTAVQWSWQFTYDTDGGPEATTTGTPAKPPTLYLPLGESVRVQAASPTTSSIRSGCRRSCSRWTSSPSRTTGSRSHPTKMGRYAGRCAELCGKDHARMLFNVEVVSPDELSGSRRPRRSRRTHCDRHGRNPQHDRRLPAACPQQGQHRRQVDDEH